MLIGYDPPAADWVVSGTGAAFVTDVLLQNGAPAEATRVRWLSSGAPAIGQYVEIQALWPVAAPIRVLALLGLQYLAGADSPLVYSIAAALPAGVKIEVRGRRVGDPAYTYALGGNALTQRTLRLPNGSAAAWFVVDADNDPLIGVAFRIYNDVNGATWADSSTFVDIGEGVINPAVEVCGRPGWSVRLVDPTQKQRTLGSQVHKVARRAYREARLQLSPATLAETRGEGLSNGQDFETIENALSGAVPAVVVPHYLGESGTFDDLELHRTALFGVAEPEPISHVANSSARNRMYEAGWLFEEVPPL